MVDWNLAATLAKSVAGEPERAAPASFRALEELARESERLVSAYTGLRPAAPIPAAEAVDRAAWVDALLVSLRATTEPLTSDLGKAMPGPLGAPLRALTGALLAAQVGVLSGVMAQRVLGQYDLALLDEEQAPRLLFVAPNLGEAARAFRADPDELLRWVALHEITHALQFGAVPWLRGYLSERLRILLAATDVKVDPRALLRELDPRELIRSARNGELLAFVFGESRRRTLDEVQAAMTVIEGYAEHVMDAVGEESVPSLPQLRAAIEQRRTNRPTVWRLIEKLLGLELKMRQYEQGKRFCDDVVRQAGIEGLNRVWSGPEALPTLPELDNPAQWLQRTAKLAA